MPRALTATYDGYPGMGGTLVSTEPPEERSTRLCQIFVTLCCCQLGLGLLAAGMGNPFASIAYEARTVRPATFSSSITYGRPVWYMVVLFRRIVDLSQAVAVKKQLAPPRAAFPERPYPDLKKELLSAQDLGLGPDGPDPRLRGGGRSLSSTAEWSPPVLPERVPASAPAPAPVAAAAEAAALPEAPAVALLPLDHPYTVMFVDGMPAVDT